MLIGTANLLPRARHSAEARDGRRAVVAGSLEELRELLAAPGKVKAGGSGHNWGADLACAGGEGEESTVVVPALGRVADGSVGESIVVDEEKGTVRADGWVLTSDLLDFLARYGLHDADAPLVELDIYAWGCGRRSPLRPI